MFGRLVAGLIVVGLAIGVWALWPAGETDATSTTTSSPSTTTSAPANSTTSDSTTTSAEASGPQVVTTVEQAEEVLRELWFGWFAGIYNQDEERIKEVVASENQLEAAIAQFGVMEFDAAPKGSDFGFSETDILRSDEECLAVFSLVQASGFTDVTFSGLHVLRPGEPGWVLVSIWGSTGDLWEQDCEALLG